MSIHWWTLHHTWQVKCWLWEHQQRSLRCIWSTVFRVPRLWCALRNNRKEGLLQERSLSGEVTDHKHPDAHWSTVPPAHPSPLTCLWEAVTPGVEKRKKVLKAGTAYRVWPARQTPADWPTPVCPRADPHPHNQEVFSPFAQLPEIDIVKSLTSENASSHFCSIKLLFS